MHSVLVHHGLGRLCLSLYKYNLLDQAICSLELVACLLYALILWLLLKVRVIFFAIKKTRRALGYILNLNHLRITT